MANFAYNITKNASTGHILFELNYEFYLQVLFKKDINPCFRFYLAKKLANKRKKFIEICCQNLYYI